ncbi:MAG: agmatinase [Prevotellaceae bacterium]|jgi:agmatinase|nr:agmatinase [Prevotellaceae bacterium]
MLLNFAETPEQYTAYENSEIVILPVPYDKTSTWMRGSEKGPAALLEASQTLEHYDIETKTVLYPRGIHVANPVLEDSTPDALCNEVENRFGKLIADKKFPVLIGGNHTVSIGAFRAVAKHYKDLTILQLDAHSDLRPTYEGTPLNHACVMSRARELAQITQVGIRSMSVDELDGFNPERIFYGHEIYDSSTSLTDRETWQQTAIDTLSKNVYITVDLDVFDPSVLPSTGTPEPGGLNYYQVRNFLRKVIDQRNVVGLDVVELCPNETEKSSDFLAAKLIYQLLCWKFK